MPHEPVPPHCRPHAKARKTSRRHTHARAHTPHKHARARTRARAPTHIVHACKSGAARALEPARKGIPAQTQARAHARARRNYSGHTLYDLHHALVQYYIWGQAVEPEEASF